MSILNDSFLNRFCESASGVLVRDPALYAYTGVSEAMGPSVPPQHNKP